MRVRPTAGLLLGFACIATPAAAQTLTVPPASCASTPPRDSASTAQARSEIRAQYAKLADAMRRKDLDALFALYTPDFHAITPKGEVWSRERSLAYQRNGMAQVQTTHHVSNTIVGFVVCGDSATATVLQYWNRTQMMAGKLRHVDTHAVQDEQWVRTPAGWRRGNIFNVRNGPAFVDGKRVNVNVPYDPDAAEYEP